jgi:hypothetical protein
VINEIQYDPVQGGVDVAFEWLELLNRTGGMVDLTGWKIADNQGVDYLPSLLLAPDEFAVVAAGSGFYDNFPNFTGEIVYVADGSIGNGLNNDGDCLSLVDHTDRVIDALSYGDNTAMMLPSCLDVSAGHSLERQPAGLDTDMAGDFIDNGAPSPGHGLGFATPIPSTVPALMPTTTPVAAPTATPITTLVPTPTPAGPVTAEGDATPTAAASPQSTPPGSPGPSATVGSTPIDTAIPSQSLPPPLTVGPTQMPSPDDGGGNTGIYVVIATFFALAGATSLVVILLRRRG